MKFSRTPCLLNTSASVHHKRWLWRCSNHSLVRNCFKKIQKSLFYFFAFEFPNFKIQIVLNLFLFFINLSLVVLIKFVLTKNCRVSYIPGFLPMSVFGRRSTCVERYISQKMIAKFFLNSGGVLKALQTWQRVHGRVLVEVQRAKHCVKRVQIRSFFWSVFPLFGLNTEIYGVNIRIQSEYTKIRTRNNSVYVDTFHAVKSQKNWPFYIWRASK